MIDGGVGCSESCTCTNGYTVATAGPDCKPPPIVIGTCGDGRVNVTSEDCEPSLSAGCRVNCRCAIGYTASGTGTIATDPCVMS